MTNKKKIIKPMELFVSRLENVRTYGTAHSARCPAHDDNENSLSVAEGVDGRVLVHCFAGCDVSDIVAEMNLTLRDLFPRTRKPIIKGHLRGGQRWR